MLLLLFLTTLIGPIINSEVLIFPIYLRKFDNQEYFYYTMNFYDNFEYVEVSLGASEFIIGINKTQYNITNINIKYDGIYPDNPISGYITTGIFNISKKENKASLNVLYNKEFYNPRLGLARRVNYDDPSIEELYNLDFMSQLIKQGIINKYYIYLTPFFDIEGNKLDDISLELGRLPIYFEDKYSYSYTPLNNMYPTKWSVKLSHIIIGDIKKENINDIYADVIFTDSYKKINYIPETLKTYFRTIFIDKMGCAYTYSSIICPIKKIEATKFYLVFNGYAHLIPNSLLYSSFGNETHKYCNFQFSSEIEYISIDSYLFGAYHRLYDGENNTVRFVYPNNDNFIVDVQEFTGYENRNGTKKEVPSIEYLKDLEKRLKRLEIIINDTLIKIENDKKIIKEKNESLIAKEIELKKYEEELKKKEKEMDEKYQKEINALKNEIKNKNETIQRLEEENTNIKKENEKLNNENKNKNETINRLREENINIKKENEKLNNDIKNKTDTINNLNEKLNSEETKSLIELISIIIVIIISIIVITIILIKLKRKKEKSELTQIINQD